MPSSIDVANYFLCLEGESSEISNLKIQKLAYYAQGFSLALHGQPLFSEPIEAWMHGPVVPDLYRRFSRYGSGAIPLPNDFNPSVFSPEQQHLLNEVFDVYGQFSAWKLRQLTHEETPWRNNFEEGEFSRTIPQQEMEAYFKEHLVN
ncbi:type II toxin-antitoxin system antitoxin SocA domain-containing protein [Pseudomonas sp. MWU15-20650]|uniref:Panacea domain-containing protein n=1 Tax=Pseudomonas sp. MWU15-20650 TaxID=2933107 RepID=UPI00200E936C|nr:type II toxin-antitoxin system antitoxin SocA domain-containing protein [Pseudomonas sp. MWU15-20650]